MRLPALATVVLNAIALSLAGHLVRPDLALPGWQHHWND
jgi:hypothetical protein